LLLGRRSLRRLWCGRGALPAGEPESGAAGGKTNPPLPTPGLKKVTWFGFVLPELGLEARTAAGAEGALGAPGVVVSVSAEDGAGFRAPGSQQSVSRPCFFLLPVCVKRCRVPGAGIGLGTDLVYGSVPRSGALGMGVSESVFHRITGC